MTFSYMDHYLFIFGPCIFVFFCNFVIADARSTKENCKHLDKNFPFLFS